MKSFCFYQHPVPDTWYHFNWFYWPISGSASSDPAKHFLIASSTIDLGTIPMSLSTSRPPLKNISVGMPLIPNFPEIFGFLSRPPTSAYCFTPSDTPAWPLAPVSVGLAARTHAAPFSWRRGTIIRVAFTATTSRHRTLALRPCSISSGHISHLPL